MPSVGVISRASALGRNHCRAERMLWSAAFSKRRTIMRLLDTLQHQAADALVRLEGCYLFDIKQTFGVMFSKFPPQFVATLGNRANTPPLSVAHFEHLIDELLGGRVPLSFNDAW